MQENGGKDAGKAAIGGRSGKGERETGHGGQYSRAGPPDSHQIFPSCQCRRPAEPCVAGDMLLLRFD